MLLRAGYLSGLESLGSGLELPTMFMDTIQRIRQDQDIALTTYIDKVYTTPSRGSGRTGHRPHHLHRQGIHNTSQRIRQDQDIALTTYIDKVLYFVKVKFKLPMGDL